MVRGSGALRRAATARNRRVLLAALGAVLALSAAPARAAPEESGTLRATAEARGFRAGVSVTAAGIADATYARLVAREFNALTPEVALKWDSIHPRPGVWEFGPADRLVEFAARHGMPVTGHTLLWHGSLPAYAAALPPDSLRAAVDEHIRTVVGRYRGRVLRWDVVNEALSDEAGLRQNVFLEKLGPGYIVEAFRVAHEADPDAALFYNDYGCEGLGGKSDRQFLFVQRLLERDVALAGVGLQMHISPLDAPPPADIAANVRRLAGLGLRVHLSEMDVRVADLRRPWFASLDPLRVQAEVYREVLTACAAEPGFDGVTFWGLTDAHSWFNDPVETDRPLLFDAQYRPKPAYEAVRSAIGGR